jgi:polysaccharide biosynthesis/export protein
MGTGKCVTKPIVRVKVNARDRKKQQQSIAMGGYFRGLIIALVCIFCATNAYAEYRLRPGDTLDVSVWQEPKLNRQVVVAPDGKISFPLAGHLKAGGLSVEAVEAKLTEKLKLQYTTDLDVTVSLASIKEEPVQAAAAEEKVPDPTFYVTGEVAKPGQFAFDRPTNVLQAIAVAGGLGPFAAGHRIKIRRKVGGEEQLFDFDYEAFISGDDLNGNIRLHHGDVIIVPEKRLFE